MYRRNGKSILLLRRLISERLRLGPASSACPPQVLRQVLPASSSYARLATDRPNTNKGKQSKGHSQDKIDSSPSPNSYSPLLTRCKTNHNPTTLTSLTKTVSEQTNR